MMPSPQPVELPAIPANPRLLVIGVARIGDTLLLTPTLRALKQHWPQAQVTVLAHPARLEVLRHLPVIDELAAVTKHRVSWRGWVRGKRYDVALVYGQDLPLLQYATRVAHRVVAFAQAAPHPLPAHLTLVPRPQQPTHAVLERLMLPAALGIRAQDLSLDYRVLPEERQAAEHWLDQQWPQRPRPLIGLQVQSFPGKAYRDWPLEHFAALIGGWCERLPDTGFVVLGDAASQPAAQRLLQLYPRHVRSAAGAFELRQSAALMQALDLYVGVDTGPTHLAGALGMPMVALYHGFHPGALLAPLQHPRLRVIEHPQCGPDCPRDAPMGAIPVEQVLAAALELWQELER